MADAEELAMLRSSIERALSVGLAVDKDTSALWDPLREVG